MSKDLVEETKEYYRQRARQYFDWANKTGKHEGEHEPDQSFYDEAGILLTALDQYKLTGDVLEIACGTGVWTEALVNHADHVTALDSSGEMIERNKSRLKANPKVHYVVADVYDWTPDRTYDAVTFSFWIEHVPSAKLNQFVSKVSECMKRDARIFFVDQQSSAKEYEAWDDPSGEVVSRTLDNGKKFRVVKHFYSPEEIRDVFHQHDIETRITNTPRHFFFVTGKKRS